MTGVEDKSGKAKDRRTPTCGLCRAHGKIVISRYHKKDCPYLVKKCPCARCSYIWSRRGYNRSQQASRREHKRQETLHKLRMDKLKTIITKTPPSTPPRENNTDCITEPTKTDASPEEKKSPRKRNVGNKSAATTIKHQASDIQRIERMRHCSVSLLQKFQCPIKKENLALMYTILKLCLENQKDVEESIHRARQEIDVLEKHNEINEQIDTLKYSSPGFLESPVNLRLLSNQWHSSVTSINPRIPSPINGRPIISGSHVSPENCPLTLDIKQKDIANKLNLPQDLTYTSIPHLWSYYYPRIMAPMGAPTYFDHSLGIGPSAATAENFLFDPHTVGSQMYYKLPLSPLSPERSASSSETSAS